MTSEVTKATSKLMFDKLVKLAVSRSVASLPFLGYPVIGWIFGLVVEFVMKKLWNEMELSATYFLIDAQEQAKLKKYNESLDNLSNALESKDKEKIRRAKNEHKEYLRKLIQISNRSSGK